jgi:hypothetical protein
MDREILLLILKEIVKDDKKFKILRKQFPEVTGDLLSFKYNPNCSCRSKVLDYFSNKIKQNKKLLDDYVKDIDSTTKDKIKNIEKKLSGKIFYVRKNSWEEFAKNLEGKYYKSFSIIEKKDELKVYFL